MTIASSQTLARVALAGAMLLAGAAVADARDWSRERTVIGPYGGVRSFAGEGRCANGACESRQRWTGPHGGSVTREGWSQCAGGRCEGGALYTGPRGRQWTTRRSFKRY